ncbi:MAG: DUF192 domain-containing protein [Elainellaceae cyanobacterium]
MMRHNFYIFRRKGLRARLAAIAVGLGLLTAGCSTVAIPLQAPVQPSSKITPPPPSEAGEGKLFASTQQGQVLPISATANIRDVTIDLEVAETLEQRAIGFMFRTEIPDNRGMLFPFSPPRPVRFWMRNVLVPLDMVFLNQGQVMAIAADVPPCSESPCPTYGPSVIIDQVIELRGGRAAELGLQVGDRVDIEFAAR